MECILNWSNLKWSNLKFAVEKILLVVDFIIKEVMIVFYNFDVFITALPIDIVHQRVVISAKAINCKGGPSK